jgi:hypothetical protein
MKYLKPLRTAHFVNIYVHAGNGQTITLGVFKNVWKETHRQTLTLSCQYSQSLERPYAMADDPKEAAYCGPGAALQLQQGCSTRARKFG